MFTQLHEHVKLTTEKLLNPLSNLYLAHKRFSIQNQFEGGFEPEGVCGRLLSGVPPSIQNRGVV
jgi:hypothetical protein